MNWQNTLKEQQIEQEGLGVLIIQDYTSLIPVCEPSKTDYLVGVE